MIPPVLLFPPVLEGVSKKSGQIFWSLQQKQLFLEQEYTLDGQNYASKGLIWDIAHVCGSKTFGDMIKKWENHFSKNCLFVTFFSKKWTCILTSTAKTMTPRAKVQFRWSKQWLLRINLRYCTFLWLKYFQRYNIKYKEEIFSEKCFPKLSYSKIMMFDHMKPKILKANQ